MTEQHKPMEGMITSHFSWQEAFITTHREIENDWDHYDVLANVIATAKKMEAVRAMLDKPLTVNSWYRNAALNAAVGGSKTSDHMVGNAVDFIVPAYGQPVDVAKAIVRCASILGFKQLILEHTWVHISFAHIPNVPPKLEVLSLLASGGYSSGLTNRYGVAYK